MPEGRYVDGTYLAHHADWHEEDAVWKASQVWAMVSKHGLLPRSVCDVGCGTAGVLARLRHRFPRDVRLVGYEPSTDALRLAEGQSEALELVNADARHCSEDFDLILMLDVFEHIEDYLGFLRSIRNKGARFIFHIPLDMSAQAVLRMRPIMGARTMTGHLHYFSRETALATLEDAGYRVLDEWYTKGAMELPRTAIRTRAAAIPRRFAYRISPGLTARVLGGLSLLVLAEPDAHDEVS